MASNVFGIPITDATLRVIPEYERRARKDRAHVALEMKKAENKDVIAREYVENLKRQWGTGVSTLCLVYNATGGTVTFVTHHDYWGHIGEAAPYPVEIANGQWGAFLHVKTTGTATGSTAAVVYRGKNEDGADCDWMFAWSNPWDRACWNNTVYTEIREAHHYDECNWDRVSELLYNSGLNERGEGNGCLSYVSTESDTSPIFEAIMTLKNA
ncbi:unnamed protein product [Camellia sinensis]